MDFEYPVYLYPKMDQYTTRPASLFDRNTANGQLLLLGALFAMCFLVAQLVAGSVLIISYGLEAVQNMPALVRSQANLNPLRYAQMLATLIGFGVPGLLFSKMKTGDFTEYSGIRNRFPALLVVLAPLLILSAYPLINVSFYINQHAFFADWLKPAQEEYALLTTALMSGSSVSLLVINLLTIAILPALAEEWLFRGTLQPLLRERMNAHLAIISTAFVFSLIHFEFSGFLPRVCLGILLGYIYQYSGSLWVSIWAHMFNNGMEVVLHFLKNTGRISMDLGNPALPTAWELLGFSAAFIALGFAFYFISRKKFDTFA